MSNTVRVRVVEYSDRTHYMMQWTDPQSGRRKSKSTGVERTGRKRERTEAERVAAQFEADLREGRYATPSKVTWQDFRERYEIERLAGLAPATASKVGTVFDTLEKHLHLVKLAELTSQRISHLQSKMRDQGLSETTIKSYLAHLKAALRWAENVGLLTKAPKVTMPRRAKDSGHTMKGRPVSGEEFDRMLEKIPEVVGDDVAPTWRHYIEGLWWSGLRLTESLDLYWDRPDMLCVDFSGKHPMLWIPAEREKGHKDRLLPMAPEFAELLDKTPAEQRTGPVFSPLTPQLRQRAGRDFVCRTITNIGEAAGVVTMTDQRTGRPKYASAHDLRRSFGERWSTRIMPAELMELMRHESFETTMKFYIGRNAQNTAATLWRAYRAANSNTFSNTPNPGRKEPNPKPSSNKGLANRPGVIRTPDQGIMSPLL